MLKVWVIDPSSMEENRGSFAYTPYYLYAAHKKVGGDVTILEDFTIAQKDLLDNIKKEDLVLISLWSYPQIELCRLLSLRLPQAKFFGYAPLIREENLPEYDITEHDILSGMRGYSAASPDFKYHLLSDCDGHLKDKPEVFPLCSSYGCTRGCSFCPVTPNLPAKHRIVMEDMYVFDAMVDYQKQVPGSGIHFTDEDFFFDTERARELLVYGNEITRRVQKEIKVRQTGNAFIALGSVTSFTAFLDSFEDDNEARAYCDRVGLYLVEIGLETADAELAKHMGKPAIQKCIDLAERVKGWNLKILWLSLTLSPGETINSIIATGNFLRKYGLDPAEMSPRIKTNGTYGGLGQFFQLYPGTRDYEVAKNSGKQISMRPTRLLPSFVPNTLLSCMIKKERGWCIEDEEWLNLFGVPPVCFLDGESVRNVFFRHKEVLPAYKIVIAVCLAARLGVITQGE